MMHIRSENSKVQFICSTSQVFKICSSRTPFNRNTFHAGGLLILVTMIRIPLSGVTILRKREENDTKRWI